MLNIKKLANLPAAPGVYFFKNTAGEIIYIGKAGNLRNRVRSYFQKGAKFFNAAKLKMLTEIVDIEILKTDSEIAALIKEAELIKKHKPRFNVLMRDSKNYLFVGFTKEDFPKIILTHQKLRDTRFKIRDYTGPFTDGGAVRKSLHLLRNIFPYCTCKQKHQTKCLNGHMGRCLTYCCLKSELESANIYPNHDRRFGIQEQYRKNIKAVRAIISGRSKKLLRELKKEIKIGIKKENFERAGELKKQISGLEEILKHAHVLTNKPEISPAIFKDDKPNFKLLGLKSNPQRIETYDISNIHGHEAVGSMVVFEQTDGIYKPNKNEYRKFKIKTVKGANDPAMIAEILRRRLNNSWPLPQLIIIDGGRTQLNAALKSLEQKGPAPFVHKRCGIRILGLAKKLEEIYLPERAEPILAQKFGQSLKHLFQAIRDEAHRFAVTYHRKFHTRSLLGS